MGIQTMSYQGGGGGGGGQQSQIQSLARQGSLYSLTLNEVQNHLGGPLNSMNLDELLKSVFPLESTTQSPLPDLDGSNGWHASGSDLQRQGSITIPQTLSKKTVDDVWKDIQQGDKKKIVEDPMPDQEWQPTLGEMTLEDFLVKAGVVEEGSDANMNIPEGSVGPVGILERMTQGPTQAVQWFQQQSYIASQPVGVSGGNVMDLVYPDEQLNLPLPMMGAMYDPQMPGQKQAASGEMVDKLGDRRQKRMIKNRESAARSRARKQAYTNELENKVSRLEEENEKLKKQKKLDEILNVTISEPKHQLRRTATF